MGLKENDGFNEEIVWFNGDESDENGLMEAMDVVLAKVEDTVLCLLFLRFVFWFIYFSLWPSVCSHIHLGFVLMDLKSFLLHYIKYKFRGILKLL